MIGMASPTTKLLGLLECPAVSKQQLQDSSARIKVREEKIAKGEAGGHVTVNLKQCCHVHIC